MKQGLGLFITNSILSSIFILLGCLLGLVLGAFLSLSAATIIGLLVHQKELEETFLYFRGEYDYVTIAMTILGGLTGLLLYLRKFIWQRAKDDPNDIS